MPLSTEWVQDPEGQGSLFVARIGHPDAKKKIMISSNEHARELLGAEVSLRFLQSACKSSSSSAFLQDATNGAFETDANTVLQNVQYTIVPVVNVKGRQLVETKTEP